MGDVNDVADVLLQARSRLIHRHPWYGTFALAMDWTPSKDVKTMGVFHKHGGKIGCVYNPEWCATMTIKQLYGIIQHEIEHLVRLHIPRIGSRNPQGWNIAADMAVNGTRLKPRVGYPEHDVIYFPVSNAIFIPDGWQDNLTAEQYYEKLEEQTNDSQCPQCGQSKDGKGDEESDESSKSNGSGGSEESDKDSSGDGQSDGSDGSDDSSGSTQKPCSGCGKPCDGKSRYGGVEGDTLDNHDVWNSSDASEEDARQYIKTLAQKATEKWRGNTPEHLKEAISELEKPKVKWRELLRSYLGRHCGNKRHTWARKNRRFRRFGMKGDSHHAAAEATVIIDTSGSISQEELQQFFAEIESILYRTTVTLVQCDAVVHDCRKYKRGDWKDIEVKGRGGTHMPAAFDYIEKNGLVSDITVLLTDGETAWPQDHGYPVIFVITRNSQWSTLPTFGNVVRLEKND